MSNEIHAFQRRDFFTCSQCFHLTFRGFVPYCGCNKRTIRWEPKHFGCGDYGASDRDTKKYEWRVRHGLLSDEEKRTSREENDRLWEPILRGYGLI